MFLLYLHRADELEGVTFHFMLESHLHSLQETSTKPLCGPCWYFFDLLVYTAGLVAIDILFDGSRKRAQQQLEVRIVTDHSLLLSLELTVLKNARIG